MEIRRLTLNDIGVVEAILSGIIDESDKGSPFPHAAHWEEFFNNTGTYLFAAMQDGKPLGYALVYSFPSLYAAERLAYLYDIEVVPDSRNRGIGKALVQALLNKLKEDGVKEIWLGTETDNTPARKLYLRTGAVQEEDPFLEYTYYL